MSRGQERLRNKSKENFRAGVLFILPSSGHPLGGGGGQPAGGGSDTHAPRQTVPTWGVGGSCASAAAPPAFWGSREAAGLRAAGEGRAAVALRSAACRAD